MLERYGEQAFKESAARADELTVAGDQNGAATWRRITEAVAQLANKTPPGPVHFAAGLQHGGRMTVIVYGRVTAGASHSIQGHSAPSGGVGYWTTEVPSLQRRHEAPP
jgi:hypothetical protein